MTISLILFLSLLFTAKAYVTINVYENDMIYTKECNPVTCDQLCRRMGFLRGICTYDNKCNCQNNVDKDAGISEGGPFNTEDPDVNLLHSCNLRACEQLCRRLGFPGGACVNGKCKCDNFRTSNAIEDADNVDGVSYNSEDSDMNQLRDCNIRACEQLCRRLGFPGGACVNGKCKCDNFQTFYAIGDAGKLERESVNTEDPDVNHMRDCNLRGCEQLCRRLGFPGGACVNGKCECDNFRTSNAVEDSGNSDGVFFNAEDTIDSIKSLECNLRACEEVCRLFGYPGGACVNGKCKCNNFRTSNTIEASAKINSEYRSCNYPKCDSRCRRLKFPRGACVNNRYKCDKLRQLLSNEDNQQEKDIECSPTICKSTCILRGQENGICIENACYCDMEDTENL